MTVALTSATSHKKGPTRERIGPVQARAADGTRALLFQRAGVSACATMLISTLATRRGAGM
jgi:hypothetical protein